MPEILWSAAFEEERDEKGKITVRPVTMVVLFLYLMTREYDYAYSIASAFREAIKEKKWTEDRGLTDLKESSKVSAALNTMARRQLLLSRDEVKSRYTKFEWPPQDDTKGKRERRYFSINPDVILSPRIVELSQERRAEILALLQGTKFIYGVEEKKQPGEDASAPPKMKQVLLQIPWEVKSDLELVMCNPLIRSDYSDSMWLIPQSSTFIRYSKYLATIRMFENYNADPMKVIEYINRIPVKDYSTILVTAYEFARELSFAYQKMREASFMEYSNDIFQDFENESAKRVFAVIRQTNRIFSDFVRIEKTRKKTLREITLPDTERDTRTYIIMVDISEFTRLLEVTLSYLIRRERLSLNEMDFQHLQSTEKDLPNLTES